VNTGAARPKVVVCGTRFGRIYLAAFRDPDFPFELAGIVARGGERSRRCAEHYGVPLYRSADEVPPEVDIACVVVSGGINAGPGAELAKQFLARGMHVLQEHQLSQDELASCLQTARRHGATYHLNTLYVHIDPVRRFIAAAREALRQRPLMYIEATTAFPVMYSMFDILGKAIGKVRPWRLPPAPPFPADALALAEFEPPFRTVEGVLAGVPCTLRVQHQMDASDPENHAHLFHRITLGTEGGSLVLVNTHGPVVWNPRPRLPQELDDTVEPREATAEYLRYPSSVPIGPASAIGYGDLMDQVWPAAVRRALTGLWQAASAGDPGIRDGQYQLGLCQLFREAAASIEPLDLSRRAYYDPLPVESLVAAAEAAVAPEISPARV